MTTKRGSAAEFYESTWETEILTEPDAFEFAEAYASAQPRWSVTREQAKELAQPPREPCSYCQDTRHWGKVKDIYGDGVLRHWSKSGDGFQVNRPCHAAAAPTGTGEGSAPLTPTGELLLESLRAENAALRSQLAKAQKYNAHFCAATGPMDEFDTYEDAIQRIKDLRSQLEEAQRENKHLQIELDDEYVADAQIQEQYEAIGRDLASAQARIARLEQALRQVNHLQHSLAIEQDGTGNMRIEYWTREIEDVVCNALNPAEPQSGEKGVS